MTGDAPHIPVFPLRRGVMQLLAVVAVGVVATVGIVVGLGWDGHLAPSLISAGICLVAAVISLVIVERASRVAVQTMMICSLAGTGVRLVVCVGGAALLIGALGYAKQPTILWMLSWYILMLLVEVKILSRYFLSLQGGMGRPDSSMGSGTESEVGTCSPSGS